MLCHLGYAMAAFPTIFAIGLLLYFTYDFYKKEGVRVAIIYAGKCIAATVGVVGYIYLMNYLLGKCQ